MPRSPDRSPDFTNFHPIPNELFAIAFRGPLPADFSPRNLVTPPSSTIVEAIDPEFGAKVQSAFDNSQLRNGWRVQEDGVVAAPCPSRFSPIAPAYQAEHDSFLQWLDEETDVEAEAEYWATRRVIYTPPTSSRSSSKSTMDTRHTIDARSNGEGVSSTPSTPNHDHTTMREKIDLDTTYSPSSSPTNLRKRPRSPADNETDMNTYKRYRKRSLSPLHDQKPRKRKIKRHKRLSATKTGTSALQEVYGSNMLCGKEEAFQWCFEQGQHDGPGKNEHNMLAIALH